MDGSSRLHFLSNIIQRRRQDYGFGEDTLGGRPSRGFGMGAESPGAGEFSKTFKKCLKKIAKNALFWP